MNKNLKFLLDKNESEKYLNRKSKELFGSNDTIEVLNLERSQTYNWSSYNVFYKIIANGQTKEIRVTASEQISKKEKYSLLKYIYDNGFNEGNFLVTKPLGYFKDYNIMVYENVSGKPFMRELDDQLEEMILKVKLCAQVLKKIHALPKPEIPLWDANDFFEFKDLERGALKIYYPKIANILDEIIMQIKEKTDRDKKPVLCHGDFHPNNVIINAGLTYVLDFDLACLTDKEYDLANFVNQLRVMIKRYGDYQNFEELKKEFLTEYGQYDLEKYSIYDALINLRILAVYCVSEGVENNLEYMPFVYDLLNKSLKNIGLNFNI